MQLKQTVAGEYTLDSCVTLIINFMSQTFVTGGLIHFLPDHL